MRPKDLFYLEKLRLFGKVLGRVFQEEKIACVKAFLLEGHWWLSLLSKGWREQCLIRQEG